MITLALAQMVFFFFLQAKFTGGEDGLQSVPRGTLLGMLDLSKDLNLYYVVMGIFIIGFYIIWRTVHSPFGQVLQALRENEPRAISLGYDVDRLSCWPSCCRRHRRPGRRHQDAGVRVGDAVRRHLADVGPGHPDDADRRAGHADRRSWAPSSSCCWRTRSATSARPWPS